MLRVPPQSMFGLDEAPRLLHLINHWRAGRDDQGGRWEGGGQVARVFLRPEAAGGAGGCFQDIGLFFDIRK